MKLMYRGVPYEAMPPNLEILTTTQNEGVFLGAKSKLRRYQVEMPRRSPVKLNYRGVTYIG